MSATNSLSPCPWCGDKRTPEIERDDIVDRVVTGVDLNNGPVYYALCQQCLARGPITAWAADVLPSWNTRAPDEQSERERNIAERLTHLEGEVRRLAEMCGLREEAGDDLRTQDFIDVIAVVLKVRR